MIILDVRESEEFEAEHIPESLFCPLSRINIMAPALLKNLEPAEITVLCYSGNRATLACEELTKIDERHTYVPLEGGIEKWKAEGKKVVGNGGIFPILRQVQIFASTMIFIAFLAAHFLNNSNFLYLALFVGFGLAMAGWTGFCPAARLIQLMPWNNKKTAKVNGNSCCR